MKKELLLKIVKGLSFTLFMMTALLGLWANWQPATYSEENVLPARYTAFDLANSGCTGGYKTLEKEICAIDGVTACSVNATSKMVGVMFVTSITNNKVLGKKIGKLAGGNVLEMQFVPVANGCPVGGITSFFLGLRQAFRIRA